MGQSIGSAGNIRKKKDAGDQQESHPGARPRRRLSAQQEPHSKKGGPDDGADHGPRTVR